MSSNNIVHSDTKSPDAMVSLDEGGGHGDGDPFGSATQKSSMIAPHQRGNDLRNPKKRGTVGGGHRTSSFGQPRNRAPSTSATSDFAMGVARVASIGNTSPIVESDDMDVDNESMAAKTPPRKRSAERTPLEPIMNDLQIQERRESQPAFGIPWVAPGLPRAPGSFRSTDASSGIFGQTSSNTKTRSYRSRHSLNTDMTDPSPFASLSSDKPVIGPASMTDAGSSTDPAAETKWLHEEDRFLIEMYDIYTRHGLTAPITYSRSGAPRNVVLKEFTRNVIAYWDILNFEKSESTVALNARLRAQNLPLHSELGNWVPPHNEMAWIAMSSEWRHDKKSTEHRLRQLLSGTVEDSSNDEPMNAASAETAIENLASIFSVSDSTSAASERSIPLGALTTDTSPAFPPRLHVSMGPPPLPVRAEPRNVEMQITMGVRSTVSPSSLPGSFRAPGASPSDLGRAVKSLRGVPGVAASSNALDGAALGNFRQSQSLSAATGSRALGSALTFGPPLVSTKGKKRSREESSDVDFEQRHNGPGPVTRNSDGFDQPRKEDDVFGPDSVRDDRSLNGKRQNRARSHTHGRNMDNFSSRGLSFPRGIIVSDPRDATHPPSRPSAHASSSSMPASLSVANSGMPIDAHEEPVEEPLQQSIAQESRVRKPVVPHDFMPAELAPGSMVGYLPQPNAEVTIERRKRDAKHLKIIGLMSLPQKLNWETRRDIVLGGLPMGVDKAEVKLLADIELVEDIDRSDRIEDEQYEANQRLKAQGIFEKACKRIAKVDDNTARAAAYCASRNVETTLSSTEGRTGMEGAQML